MIIYYSMIVWTALIYFLTYVYTKTKVNSGGLNLDNGISANQKGYVVSKFCAALVFGYIIFWVGIRTRHGDTYGYILSYQKTTASFKELFQHGIKSSKGPLFAIFSTLIKSIAPNDVTVFLFTIALIQGIPIFLTLRKYSENYFYSVFLFITTCSLFWMMNGIRQFIAVAILFGCTRLLIERKWFLYTVIVLILSLVHYTALIMIPIYWMVTSKPWKFRSLLFIAIFVLCTVFVNTFSDVLEFLLEDTLYADSTSQFEQDDGVNPLRLIVSLIPVVFSLIFRKKIEAENNRLLDVMVNMSLITSLLYLVGMRTSGILIGRLPIYTSLYSLMLLPYIFNHYLYKKDRIIMYVLCVLGYMVFFYLQTQGFFYRSDLTGTIN